jgi:hypothetical protein
MLEAFARRRRVSLAVFGFLVGPAGVALSLYAFTNPLFGRLEAWCALAGAVILTVGSIGRLILYWHWTDDLTAPENLEPHQRLLAWVIHRGFLVRKPSPRTDRKILPYVLPSSRAHHELCYQALQTARDQRFGSGWKAPALLYPDLPTELGPGSDVTRFGWLDPSGRWALFRIPLYALQHRTNESQLLPLGLVTFWAVRSDQGNWWIVLHSRQCVANILIPAEVEAGRGAREGG